MFTSKLKQRKHFVVYVIVVFSLLLGFVSNSGLAAEITGLVDRVKDGDSLIIWNSEIRLVDIDAFEYTQECVDANNKTYLCGVKATQALANMVKDKLVTCQGTAADRYERLLATCHIQGLNINEVMVAEGWAVNYNGGTVYQAAQIDAKANRKGAWQGSFIDPKEARKRSQESAKSEQEFKQPLGDKKDCIIKGNISADGVKIYHTPWGSTSYSRTRISTQKGERWFCTEAEAKAAGWRAPSR